MTDDPKRPEPWRVTRTQWRPWQRPFIAFEWLTEWGVYFLDRWAFLRLLNAVGSFSLIVAMIAYCQGGPARQLAQENAIKAKHYQAWQVINTAQGHGGNGGRSDALKELNDDGIDLTGVNIQSAWLPGLLLPMSRLRDAIADSAYLIGADLRGADLSNAHLTGARLDSADLRGAVLHDAILERVNLNGADLRFADFSRAKLHGARLIGANLANASLAGADLAEASLEGAKWDSTSLSFANLRGASVSPEDMLRGALFKETNLASISFPRSLLSVDSFTVLSRRRGAVFFSHDLGYALYVLDMLGRKDTSDQTSHAYAVWSAKRKLNPDIDLEFPPRRVRQR